MFKASGMASESYWELMSSILPLRDVKITYMNRHLYSYPFLKVLQISLGVFSFTFDNFHIFFTVV